MLFSGYKCDKCGATVTHNVFRDMPMNSKTALMSYARASGWSIGERKVLCPVCRKR